MRRTGWTCGSGCVSRRPDATLYHDQRMLQKDAVLLLEAKKAMGMWRTGSLKPKPPFLMEARARSQAEANLKGGRHLLNTDEEATQTHRAGMVAHLAPAEAEAKKDEGGRGRLELLLEAEVPRAERGTQKSEAFVVSDLPSCRGFRRMSVLGEGFGWDVLTLLSGLV